MQTNIIHRGDVRDVLKRLPDESVHCVVTSPPYWGLRDYGVDGQIGLEDSPEAFVAAMVEVFREVRRVLRKDGTCWINLGDSYAASSLSHHGRGKAGGPENPRRVKAQGLKAKDLVGIPWRVALALQDDGWWLRSDVVWSKPNPMPESVTDRPARAHEYVFLLTRSPRYFYDAEAVRESSQSKTRQSERSLSFNREVAEPDRPGQTYSQHRKGRQPWPQGWATSGKHDARSHNKKSKRRTVRPCDTRGGGQGTGEMTYPAHGRNLRTVWEIATHPFPEAHFATFPPALVEPCIKAGCPSGGVVLDPFMGAGTVGLVATKLGRRYVGIELNPEYAAMAERRIQREAGLLACV